MEMRSRSRSVIEVTMAARAPGTVSSTSRFHFFVRWGGQRMRILRKPDHVRRGRADEGLAGAHLADDGGSAVCFEGEDRAPDGVLLRAQGGAEQVRKLATDARSRLGAGLRGSVERRV